MSESDIEELEQAAKEAEALMHAAAALDRIGETAEEMVEEGEMPDDEASDTLSEDIETAKEVCEKVSVTITLALAQKGYVPDFDAVEDRELAGTVGEEDDDEDFERSAFQ